MPVEKLREACRRKAGYLAEGVSPQDRHIRAEY
jgi:hypothetical protein